MADDFLTPERALNDYIEEQKELADKAVCEEERSSALKAAIFPVQEKTPLSSQILLGKRGWQFYPVIAI